MELESVKNLFPWHRCFHHRQQGTVDRRYRRGDCNSGQCAYAAEPQAALVGTGPGEWWQAVSLAIRAVLAQAGLSGESVQAVGLTGQMHGLVLLDEDGQVLRPAILWNDQRTQPQCDEIHRRIGRAKFIRITGNVALTGFTAPKILWVQENEPEVYARARHVLLPKDYIRFKLTGEYAMDKADGAGTVLFDLKQRDWSAEVLTALGIPQAWMPATFEGPEFTGRIERGSGSRDRTESRYSGGGRRRRPGSPGGRRGRGGTRRGGADGGHQRRGVCHNPCGAGRAGGDGCMPSVTPYRACGISWE